MHPAAQLSLAICTARGAHVPLTATMQPKLTYSSCTAQAWAVMEGEAGNVEDARELFRRALAVKANPQTLSAMATLERRCTYDHGWSCRRCTTAFGEPSSNFPPCATLQCMDSGDTSCAGVVTLLHPSHGAMLACTGLATMRRHARSYSRRWSSSPHIHPPWWSRSWSTNFPSPLRVQRHSDDLIGSMSQHVNVVELRAVGVLRQLFACP
jgi:hypothetical protein